VVVVTVCYSLQQHTDDEVLAVICCCLHRARLLSNNLSLLKMPPRSRPTCQVCQTSESKYNCPKCRIAYCSLVCYKTHQDPGKKSAEQPVCTPTAFTEPAEQPLEVERRDIEMDEPLRPLTSLRWPYIPEESAYPDPLKRDDPKVVQLRQYEAIATSAAVRKVLSERPNLKPLLRTIDSLRGTEREAALQRALGVSQEGHQGASGPNGFGIGEEDIEAVRQLSSTIEVAIRGERPSMLGLDLNGG